MKKICRKAPYSLALAILIPFAFIFSHNTAYGQTEKKPAYLTTPQALEVLLKRVEKEVVDAAEAMPAVKYQFTPTVGEFRDVRTFGQQVKHLSATNYILGAAALGENPPADAGDEMGPDTVRTKAQIIHYLKASFDYLHKAMLSIDEKNQVIRSSSISPLFEGTATRLGLVVESLIHAFNHYGQMVEYLRMNDVIPPSSR